MDRQSDPQRPAGRENRLAARARGDGDADRLAVPAAHREDENALGSLAETGRRH